MLAKPGNLSKLPYLDAVRGLAITLVIIFHAGLLDMGWLGVPLFFCLSGFLITRGLLATKECGASAYFFRFYKRRVLRIFPLYYAFLLCIAIASLCFPLPGMEDPPWSLLTTFTFNFQSFLSGRAASGVIVHLWSLSVEEQFYLVWPFVVFLCPLRVFPLLLAIFIGMAPLFRFTLANLLPQSMDVLARGQATYTATFSHLDSLCFGALLAFQERSGTLQDATITRLLLTGLLVSHLVVVVIIFGGSLNAAVSVRIPELLIQNGSHLFLLSAVAAGSAEMIRWAALRAQPPSGYAMQLLARLGTVSYGLYLFHVPMRELVKATLQPFPLLSSRPIIFIVYGAFSYLMAELSYRWFEKRFLAQ